MTKRAQKIWATRGFASLTKYGGILELIMPGDTEEDYLRPGLRVTTMAHKKYWVEVQDLYDLRTALPDEHWPKGLYVGYNCKPETAVKHLRDVITTQLGFILISQRFYDVLQDFNLGRTEVRKMPIYGSDRKTLLPMTYYMVQMLEFHPFMVPEDSQTLSPYGSPYGLQFAVYVEKPSDKMTLRVPPEHSLDLWMDTQVFNNWVFVSDRLKEAIKAAELMGYQFSFRACRLAKPDDEHVAASID